MAYGLLTAEMIQVLKPLVRDQVVWDLGAGDCTRADCFLGLGALQVICIDKAERNMIEGDIVHVQAWFKDVEVPSEGIPVAFVGWPVSGQPYNGLREILKHVERVLYLGCNTGGSACGRGLFADLSRRRLLSHVAHHQNSLLVYGEHVGERPLVGEEYAALSEDFLFFEKAEHLAKHEAL